MPRPMVYPNATIRKRAERARKREGEPARQRQRNWSVCAPWTMAEWLFGASCIGDQIAAMYERGDIAGSERLHRLWRRLERWFNIPRL
jgi:hypothetical protein